MALRRQFDHKTPIVGDITENSSEFLAVAAAISEQLQRQRRQEMLSHSAPSAVTEIRPYDPDLITVETK